MAAIEDAMTDFLLAVCVPGTVALALAVDLGAIAAWLRSRWRSARN
jgi:hypothetical protein